MTWYHHLIWITGLSGAGKSTVARELFNLMKAKKENVMGIGISMIEPENSDLILDNDGNTAPRVLAERIF